MIKEGAALIKEGIHLQVVNIIFCLLLFPLKKRKSLILTVTNEIELRIRGGGGCMSLKDPSPIIDACYCYYQIHTRVTIVSAPDRKG